MELLSRIIAFILLIVLSPFLIIISTICLIFQGYPILFKQKRVGFQYRTFKIYKFRTMKVNSGPLITKERDARITFIGWLLRKFKIDEIPQLLNILKGEMRFIGPRPEVLEYFEESSFSFLKKIKPGISDFSSIIFRDESKVLDKIGGKNPYADLLPIKLKLSEYYAKNKSFLLDLKLVLITMISIFLPNYPSRKFVIPDVIKNVPETKSFIDKYIF